MDDNQKLLINNTDTYLPKTIKTILDLKKHLENIESNEVKVVLANSVVLDDDKSIESLLNLNIQIFKKNLEENGNSFVYK